MNHELKHALNLARQDINAQAVEAGVDPLADFELDACIAEDGESVILFVEMAGHVFTASVPVAALRVKVH